MLLVMAFSFGLAAVLAVVGLLFIKGSRLIEGTRGSGAVMRYAPVLSATLILVVGVVISAQAFSTISF